MASAKSARAKDRTAPAYVPSKATRTEDETAKAGTCGQCGRDTTVHWYVAKVGWRCRECHPARAATEYIGGRKLEREVLGPTVAPGQYATGSDFQDDERLP